MPLTRTRSCSKCQVDKQTWSSTGDSNSCEVCGRLNSSSTPYDKFELDCSGSTPRSLATIPGAFRPSVYSPDSDVSQKQSNYEFSVRSRNEGLQEATPRTMPDSSLHHLSKYTAEHDLAVPQRYWTHAVHHIFGGEVTPVLDGREDGSIKTPAHQAKTVPGKPQTRNKQAAKPERQRPAESIFRASRKPLSKHDSMHSVDTQVAGALRPTGNERFLEEAEKKLLRETWTLEEKHRTSPKYSAQRVKFSNKNTVFVYGTEGDIRIIIDNVDIPGHHGVLKSLLETVRENPTTVQVDGSQIKISQSDSIRSIRFGAETKSVVERVTKTDETCAIETGRPVTSGAERRELAQAGDVRKRLTEGLGEPDVGHERHNSPEAREVKNNPSEQLKTTPLRCLQTDLEKSPTFDLRNLPRLGKGNAVRTLASGSFPREGTNLMLNHRLTRTGSPLNILRYLTLENVRLKITNDRLTGVEAQAFGWLLCFAIWRGHADLVALLLRAGVDMNRREHYTGLTPLHHAVLARSPAMVRLLFEHGVIVSVDRYDRMSHRLETRWVDRIISALAYRENTDGSQQARDSETSDTTSGGQKKETTRSSVPASTIIAGQHNLRRSLSNDGNSASDDEDRRKKHGRGLTSTHVTAACERSSKFACPYAKYNPARFGDDKSCGHKGFDNIPRLKEHLHKKHRWYQCERCGDTDFQNYDDVNDHIAADKCMRLEGVQRDYSDGFDRRQCDRMKKWKYQDEEEKWKKIYRILFELDDADPLPSPFFETIAQLRSENQEYREENRALQKENRRLQDENARLQQIVRDLSLAGRTLPKASGSEIGSGFFGKQGFPPPIAGLVHPGNITEAVPEAQYARRITRDSQVNAGPIGKSPDHCAELPIGNDPGVSETADCFHDVDFESYLNTGMFIDSANADADIQTGQSSGDSVDRIFSDDLGVSTSPTTFAGSPFADTLHQSHVDVFPQVPAEGKSVADTLGSPQDLGESLTTQEDEPNFEYRMLRSPSNVLHPIKSHARLEEEQQIDWTQT